ncbi:hypothetical protein [Pseudotabrizicola algicola]|uniref:VPEID-CTERM sorting domain-containing protein n=1 Tax=Pseudotabrizicola algicola TaxID=2709381 RepID=A0A6B3RTF5_9RHOB|nr:hypothetical protein [Pseudotabrizicola algicola]NEX48048.1 hypothetical protein [Pseudotabrizicola algicola]
MSRITALVASLALAASATVASAGGLAAPEEDNTVIAVVPGAKPVGSMGNAGVAAAGAAALLLALALKKNNSGSH